MAKKKNKSERDGATLLVVSILQDYDDASLEVSTYQLIGTGATPDVEAVELLNTLGESQNDRNLKIAGAICDWAESGEFGSVLKSMGRLFINQGCHPHFCKLREVELEEVVTIKAVITDLK